MKRTSWYRLLLMLLALGAGNALAEESQANIEERCRTYAREDGIPAAELAEYIQDCVESLRQGDAEQKEKSD